MITKTISKCDWCLDRGSAYEKYHDEEWGVPTRDDRKHFEFLILESAQAGLSWATVLKRRNGYRAAFSNFDPALVALYDENKKQKLYRDKGIIRNKLKIDAAIHNASLFLEIQKEVGSFSDYIWGFVGGKPVHNHWKTAAEVPATSPQSDALSKDLKKRGFKFVGSTILYAHMQACGLVMDHTKECYRYKELTQIA